MDQALTLVPTLHIMQVLSSSVHSDRLTFVGVVAIVAAVLSAMLLALLTYFMCVRKKITNSTIMLVETETLNGSHQIWYGSHQI